MSTRQTKMRRVPRRAVRAIRLNNNSESQAFEYNTGIQLTPAAPSTRIAF